MMYGIILLVAILLALLTLAVLVKKRWLTVPFLYKARSGQFYRIATYETYDLLSVDMDSVREVAIKNKHRLPVPLQMMADPFVIKHNKEYYIFYEELTQKKYAKGADIAVLHSHDGEQWKRMGVAIREPFHLSFPNVFLYKGEYYMIPEALESGEMRIYKAVDFPMKWKKFTVPLKDITYSDPMIYIQDDYIYLWYNTYTDGDDLRLIYAKDINGPWIEHPMSPIRKDGAETRPAGTINNVDGKLFYFIQDHSEGYGTGVIAYQIEKLSPTEYNDKRMENNPLLWKNGDSWAKDGMHQYSMVQREDGIWLCVMDGCRNATQSGWKWNWRNWPIPYLR